MKFIKRFLIYFSLFVAVILISGTASVFLFKDKIIQQFIREANKNLNTSVKIGNIDISFLKDFPNLAIICRDVYVEDSHPGQYPLLTAEHLYFFINPVDAWRGNYSIRGLHITNSETHLKINEAGVSNYDILKHSNKSESSSVGFDLRNVRLRNTHVIYHDLDSKLHHVLSSSDLSSTIVMRDDVYTIEARGDVTTEQIGVDGQNFLVNKFFYAISTLIYDDHLKLVTIQPSQLVLRESGFELQGTYSFKEKNRVDLSVQGKNTDIQLLLSLLPEETSKKLAQYQSTGEAYFDMKVSGELSSPASEIHFGLTNATLYHPDIKTRIIKVHLDGVYANTSMLRLETANLSLKNMNGELNGQKFSANLILKNFKNPFVSCDFTGDLEIASLFSFYPIAGIQNPEGKIQANLSLEGKIELLKSKVTAQQVKTSGSVRMENLQFDYGPQSAKLREINGALQFNNNDLAISNVSLRFGDSDFLLNGFFKNIVTYLLFEDQPIGIETDLKSNFVDLDRLFELGFTDEGVEEYHFRISPNLHLNFNCDIKQLHYKRFKPANITGNLLVKNQMALLRNAKMSAMGGAMTFDGMMIAENPKAIEVSGSFGLSGIHVDSIFYVFENFKQDFLEDRHLKGQAFAEVTLEMTLNEKLKLFPETLIADITATIMHGELNNFDPLKALSKYLDDDGLAQLRFADLKNDIHIENKTIYLPQMEVRSNVTQIQMSGTHTFDHHIDYRIVAPLRNKKKIDKDEAFGAIEEDGTGKAKLFLKITGTTDDYKVSYDKDAVKHKLAGDFRKEIQELKDAFKLKGKKKKKEIELSDEEFDWDNQ